MIEPITQTLESLGFTEVVLSTTEVFYQKKDVKVYITDHITISKWDENTGLTESMRFRLTDDFESYLRDII